MNIRTFELFLTVGIIFVLGYFLLYVTYFDSFCKSKGGFIGQNKHTTMVLMGKCKDSYVCDINNIEYDDLNRDVVSWTCDKAQVNYFEPNYYKQRVQSLFQ